MDYHGNNPLGFDDEQPPLGDVHGFGFQPQVHVMRRPAARPIGAFDQPILRENRTGIPTPVIAANDFEVKSSLITMVQNQRYDGLPLEDPLDHLDMFERLCRTVKMNGVPEDAMKMILFPFSLGNKASQWERNVPSEVVSTWNDVKKEFITKFYPKQKTAKLRNDITSFKQGVHENLYEAWERLKDYTRKCPHHGVSKGKLLGIFYRGALEHYKRALDTASYGCFTNLTVEEGEQLIENFAQSEECYGREYDRGTKNHSYDNQQQIKELNKKIEKLSRVFLVNQKAVNFVGEAEAEQQGYSEVACDGFQGVYEEVSYVGNQNNYQGGFQNRPYNRGYRNNNLSYRSNNVENPQDQYYPPRAPQGNSYQPRPSEGSPQSYNAPWKSQGVLNSALAIGYQGEQKYRQDGYPAAQSAGQDDIRTMMKQLMESQSRVQAELTEKLEKFERKIDSNHGEAQAKFEDIYSHLKNLDNQIAQVVSTSQRPAGSSLGKLEKNPKAFCNAVTLRSGKELGSKEHAQDANKEIADEDVQLEEVQTYESKEVKDSSEPGKGKSEPIKLTKNYIPPPPYQPQLPFPGRFKKQLLAVQKEKFLALMDGVKVTLPLMDIVKNNPTYSKLLKEMLSNKQKVEETLMPKKDDPWSELKALQTELKQLPPGEKGEENIEQKQGGKLAPIDRSPDTDRSISSWKNHHGNAGSIEPAQVDRSKNKEPCKNDPDRSFIFRSIDRPPDDKTPGGSSKRAGKRPTASPTTSLNKKKVKMKSQGRAPPFKEEEGDTQKLIRGKKTLVSPHCLSPI